MARGSEIVFDYALPDSLLGDGERQLWKAGRSDSGESLVRQFDPVKLAEHLKDMGFTEVSDFGPEEENALYLNGRTDGLSPFVLDGLSVSVIRLFHIMKATV
jgi:O-methyltransferase involved in polyketide biosynthesis